MDKSELLDRLGSQGEERLRIGASETIGNFLLPRLLEVDGVWLAVPLAELLSCLLSVWFLRRKRAAFGFGGGDLPRHGGRGGGRI